MLDFSPIQILIVLAIALLVLGPKRLPEMGRSLGRGLREFKGSMSNLHDPDDDSPDTTPAPAPVPPPPAAAEADEMLEPAVPTGARPSSQVLSG